MGKSLNVAQSEAPLHFLGVPEHPDVTTLSNYWDMKRGTRAMLDRADIVPSEIIRLLPFLFICEVINQGEDFRFRLCGTAIVDLVGVELTGKQILNLGTQSQIVTNIAAAKRRWHEIVAVAFKTLQPTFVTSTFVNTVHRQIVWHSFTAPLTTGGAEVTQVLGGLFFDPGH